MLSDYAPIYAFVKFKIPRGWRRIYAGHTLSFGEAAIGERDEVLGITCQGDGLVRAPIGAMCPTPAEKRIGKIWASFVGQAI